jgi:hypothetical protein
MDTHITKHALYSSGPASPKTKFRDGSNKWTEVVKLRVYVR